MLPPTYIRTLSRRTACTYWAGVCGMPRRVLPHAQTKYRLGENSWDRVWSEPRTADRATARRSEANLDHLSKGTVLVLTNIKARSVDNENFARE